MNHCTICGAAARDNASFCTSCGARLNGTDARETPMNTEPEAANKAAAIPTISGTDEIARANDSHSDTLAATETTTFDPPKGGSDSDDSPSPPADFVASWPTPESSNTGAEPTEPPTTASDAGGGQEAISPAAAWTSNTENTMVNGAGAERNQGTSGWGGRASRAPSSTSAGERLAQMRQLVNELGDQIERLGKEPAALSTRDLDPDDLADTLASWSHAVPDTDMLLADVQQVRKAPRNLDAITRLADRAADLEALVQHYQSITSRSGNWATKLRRDRPAPKRPGRRLGSMGRDRTSESSESTDSAPDS